MASFPSEASSTIIDGKYLFKNPMSVSRLKRLSSTINVFITLVPPLLLIDDC
jgi:hypothetical protein